MFSPNYLLLSFILLNIFSSSSILFAIKTVSSAYRIFVIGISFTFIPTVPCRTPLRIFISLDVIYCKMWAVWCHNKFSIHFINVCCSQDFHVVRGRKPFHNEYSNGKHLCLHLGSSVFQKALLGYPSE